MLRRNIAIAVGVAVTVAGGLYIMYNPGNNFQAASSSSTVTLTTGQTQTFALNLPQVQAVTVDSLVDAVSVNVGSPSNTAYFAAGSADYINYVKNPLTTEGIRYIRYVMPDAANSPSVGMLHDLYATTGVKVLLTTKLQHMSSSANFSTCNVAGWQNSVLNDAAGDAYTISPCDVPAIVNAIGVSAVLGIEGPNEYSNGNTNYTGWMTPLYNYWQAVRTNMKSSSGTASVAMIAPTLGPIDDNCLFDTSSNPWKLRWPTPATSTLSSNPSQVIECYDPALNWGAISDFGNVHTYVRPYTSDKNLYPQYDWQYQSARYPSTLPIWYTEVGSNTSTQATGSWTDGVPETVQAQNVWRDILDGFQQLSLYQTAAKHLFIYMNTDILPASAGTPLSNYGLFRVSASSPWVTQKTSALLTKNMISLLSDSKSFTPGKLSLQVTNLPSTAKSLVLEKSDGTFYAVLWDDVGTTNDAAVAATSNVTLQFGQAIDSVASYNPIVNTVATNVAINPADTSVTVAVGSSPVVVKITPGQGTSGGGSGGSTSGGGSSNTTTSGGKTSSGSKTTTSVPTVTVTAPEVNQLTQPLSATLTNVSKSIIGSATDAQHLTPWQRFIDLIGSFVNSHILSLFGL